jgi:alcohol dehydrogenase class IV
MQAGIYRYLALDQVHFGRKVADALREEAASRGAAGVFVVTSRSLNRNTDAVKEAITDIADRVVDVFDECVEHAPRPAVLKLVERMRAAPVDLVVSIGGGTVIDTVKIALLCLAESVQSEDDFDRCRIVVREDGSRHVPHIDAPPYRQIAVPTTLSAAEFSDLGGCVDVRGGQKHLYTSPLIGPAAVILDPSITVHTPARLWLSTGVRAVDHAIEALCSPGAQALTDANCLHALKLLSQSLPLNRTDPCDLNARLQSQLGVWLASSGINRVDFGASHGIGHVLGGALGVPHGLTSAALLPAVLEFNSDVCSERQEWISRALGFPGQPAWRVVKAFIETLGLPSDLRQLGVPRERFAEIAAKALANPWVRTNPKPVERVTDVLEILRRAYE